MDDEILICVADDIGIRVWLERTLDGTWPIEFVAASDLSRANRLIEATGSRFVVVAVDDNEPEKALRLISALSQSRQELLVVSVARRIGQDFLLRSMRAGARDCFIASSDGEEIRSRIEQLLHADPDKPSPDDRPNRRRKITLVTSASPGVDARLFTQSLVFALNQRQPQTKILALDTAASGHYVFYLDSNNRLTFQDLLQNTESLDATLIETALEEYAPKLRLLAGRLPLESTASDRNIELLIAMSRLVGMFDRVVINVDPAAADFWVSALGLYARDLFMVTHPIVEQAHTARDCLEAWQPRLSKQCRLYLLLDCYEAKGSPTLNEFERAIGIGCLGTLPLDWQNRLTAINAGLPMHRLPRKSSYQRRLDDLVKRYETGDRPSKKAALHRRLLRLGRGG